MSVLGIINVVVIAFERFVNLQIIDYDYGV